jgi:hypothetical protein
MPIASTLADLLAPLQAKREELLTLEAKAMADLDNVRADLRAVARVLKAADPDYGKHSNGNRPKAPSPGKVGFGPELLRLAVEWVQQHPVDQEFQQVELRNDVPAFNSTSKTATLFGFFRDEGFIRFVRQDGPRKYYAWTGDEPSEHLVERMNRDGRRVEAGG